MNWQEYQENTPRTLASIYTSYGIDLVNEKGNFEFDQTLKDLCFKVDLAHMALGLSSEIEELMSGIERGDSINISEEFADMLWYCSNIIFLFDKENVDLISCKQNFSNLAISAFEFNILHKKVSKFTNIIKKMLAYKKVYSSVEIDDALHSVIYIIFCLMLKYKCDIDKSLQNNIDKLKARYPEKFTESHAINRNLDAERKELEK